MYFSRKWCCPSYSISWIFNVFRWTNGKWLGLLKERTRPEHEMWHMIAMVNMELYGSRKRSEKTGKQRDGALLSKVPTSLFWEVAGNPQIYLLQLHCGAFAIEESVFRLMGIKDIMVQTSQEKGQYAGRRIQLEAAKVTEDYQCIGLEIEEIEK